MKLGGNIMEQNKIKKRANGIRKRNRKTASFKISSIDNRTAGNTVFASAGLMCVC